MLAKGERNWDCRKGSSQCTGHIVEVQHNYCWNKCFPACAQMLSWWVRKNIQLRLMTECPSIMILGVNINVFLMLCFSLAGYIALVHLVKVLALKVMVCPIKSVS